MHYFPEVNYPCHSEWEIHWILLRKNLRVWSGQKSFICICEISPSLCACQSPAVILVLCHAVLPESSFGSMILSHRHILARHLDTAVTSTQGEGEIRIAHKEEHQILQTLLSSFSNHNYLNIFCKTHFGGEARHTTASTHPLVTPHGWYVGLPL